MLRRILGPLIVSSVCIVLPLLLVPDWSLFLPIKKLLKADIFFFLPFLLIGATAVLSQLLHLNRIFYSSLCLGLGFWFLEKDISKKLAISAPLKVRVFTLAVLVSLLLISILPRLRTKNKELLSNLLILIGPLASLIFLVKQAPKQMTAFLQLQFLSDFGFVNLPEVSAVPFIILLVVTFSYSDRYLREFYGFLFVSLLTIFSMLEYKGFSIFDIRMAFVACGFLFLYAMIRIYWQKIYMDELTNIPNRRALNEALARLGPKFTIAMADVDHFKKFNDTYGHDEGDNVLRMVGKHLDQYSKGRAYRYGGEEFTILFDDFEPDDVKPELDQIRKSLAEKEFVIRGKKAARTPKDRGKVEKSSNVQVTISIGVASNCDAPRSLEEVFKAADEALYKAKENGRNCVILA